jgi:hypothetical protein
VTAQEWAEIADLATKTGVQGAALPEGVAMSHELTAQEWAEMAHLANVASHLQPNLVPLRDKVREIAILAQIERPSPDTYTTPLSKLTPQAREFWLRGGTEADHA